MRVPLTRKLSTELHDMEFWKSVRVYEDCISQKRRRRQKTNLKKQDWETEPPLSKKAY
jgi:hypothetical protein